VRILRLGLQSFAMFYDVGRIHLEVEGFILEEEHSGKASRLGRFK
jgi:hypothetical protein